MTRPEWMVDYLQRVDAAARALPRAERRELRAEIEQHLRDALADDDGETALREALERLGDPREIVAQQLHSAPPSPPPRRVGAQQWSAIVLLLAGGFLAGVGWIIGLVLLWSLRAWSVREKLIGTLLVPGGLATAFYIGLWAGGRHAPAAARSACTQTARCAQSGAAPARPRWPTGCSQLPCSCLCWSPPS